MFENWATQTKVFNMLLLSVKNTEHLWNMIPTFMTFMIGSLVSNWLSKFVKICSSMQNMTFYLTNFRLSLSKVFRMNSYVLTLFYSKTLEKAQIPTTLIFINSYEPWLTEQIFRAKGTVFKKFQFHIWFRSSKKSNSVICP